MIVQKTNATKTQPIAAQNYEKRIAQKVGKFSTTDNGPNFTISYLIPKYTA